MRYSLLTYQFSGLVDGKIELGHPFFSPPVVGVSDTHKTIPPAVSLSRSLEAKFQLKFGAGDASLFNLWIDLELRITG